MACLYKITCLENGKASIGLTMVADVPPLRVNALIREGVRPYDDAKFRRETLLVSDDHEYLKEQRR